MTRVLSIKKILNDNYVKFIIFFLSLYAFLYFFNIGFIGITSPNGIYIKFLDEHLNYIKWWRTFSIEATAFFIDALGYKVYTNATQLAVLGKSGFTLVYECLGYAIMSAFAAFVIAFPKPIKSKVIFLIGGLIFIQTMNLLRFILLALFWNHRKSIFGLDHHTFFNVCIYLLLISICYIWVNQEDKQYAKN